MKPIFATGYLPPIAYIAKLMQFDEVLVEQMETFPKQTYRNRAVIATANGLLPLIVPAVRTDGNHTMTRDMGISHVENWPIKHLRAIEAAYSASPYYLYYKDEFEAILAQKHERLIDLNSELLRYLLKKLKIDCHISLTDDFAEPGSRELDFRRDFSVKGHYTTRQFPEYDQVFAAKMPFQPNLSIIDLLFNLGPDAKRYLKGIAQSATTTTR